MVILEELLKNKISSIINDILLIEDNNWINMDLNIKFKYIHHLCSCIEKNIKNIDTNINLLSIPLKTIKPKKLIQLCNFNKQNNKQLYNEYLKNILDYTFVFRKKYILVKKRIYYNFVNLPLIEYNTILSEYNYIIYLFLKNNINKINIAKLFTHFTQSNINKIFINNQSNLDYLNIEYNNNIIILYFSNNIKITLTLLYNSDNITNNIPVKYKINLINNI